MIGLDTNVLLRLLVEDGSSAPQVRAARLLVEGHDKFFISHTVFLETMWVLARKYKMPKAGAADIGQRLLSHPKLDIEQRPLMQAAMTLYSSSPGIGFGDALALACARAANIPLHTFDRKLAKLDGARLVPVQP